LRTLVVVEVNNLGFIHLRMIGVDWVGMGNDLLMGVRLNTMLMPFPAMAVLSIQMRMGRRPLERNKNGKQKKNKRSVGASLDHGVGRSRYRGEIPPHQFDSNS